jgi:capsid protein
MGHILDHTGRPIVTASPSRKGLDEHSSRAVHARYDASQDSDEFRKYWAAADAYDADSAHSREVRIKLIHRSRYEIGNSGFSDGIAQTYATDLVGNGPTLRMQTRSKRFNELVETEWQAWIKAVQFRRKLWCLAHAKHGDGEGMGVMRRNPRVKHAVPLDVVLYEAEQFQSDLLYSQPGRIDGMKFDEFGNVVIYELLRQHPGSAKGESMSSRPEQIAADRVIHWFKLRRPGQHRAVPEMASTLNTGAAARRWREATIAAAETAADFALILQTAMNPDGEVDPVQAMSSFEIKNRMMVAAPMGWQGNQMKAEHPNAQYEAFNKTLINEQARPKSMPYNKAACDSSDYNYASGRLDHQTYYAALDVERGDCDDLVMDPLFDVWFDLAVVTFGWLGGDPDAISPRAKAHIWDWPKHRVADVKVEAQANATKLKTAQIALHRLYSDAGLDLEEEIELMATTFDVDVKEIRQRLLDITLPAPKVSPAGPPPGHSDTNDAVGAMLERLQSRGGTVNGHGHKNNGAQHAQTN